MAAPPLNPSPLPETQRSLAVPVNQSTLPNSGEVSEAIHTGSYTYLHVTKDGQDEWLAIPSREVAVGADVSYGNGAVMKNFHSGSLNRTFDEILFLGGVEVAGESAAAVAPVDPSAQTLPPGHSPVPTTLPPGHALAVPQRDIPVGAHVRYAPGMSMKDFHSSALDRTFKEVLFLGGVVLAEE
jgi:hypothetical protein